MKLSDYPTKLCQLLVHDQLSASDRPTYEVFDRDLYPQITLDKHGDTMLCRGTKLLRLNLFNFTPEEIEQKTFQVFCGRSSLSFESASGAIEYAKQYFETHDLELGAIITSQRFPYIGNNLFVTTTPDYVGVWCQQAGKSGIAITNPRGLLRFKIGNL